MSIYSILVTNNAPGCSTEIEQQLTVKSLFEDHDFGSIGRHADRVEKISKM